MKNPETSNIESRHESNFRQGEMVAVPAMGDDGRFTNQLEMAEVVGEEGGASGNILHLKLSNGELKRTRLETISRWNQSGSVSQEQLDEAKNFSFDSVSDMDSLRNKLEEYYSKFPFVYGSKRSYPLDEIKKLIATVKKAREEGSEEELRKWLNRITSECGLRDAVEKAIG